MSAHAKAPATKTAATPAAKPGAAKPAAGKPVAPQPFGKRLADQEKGAKPGSVPAGVSAGPSQDDRGIQNPKKLLQGELTTRMLAYSVADGGTVITLAAGLGQGVYDGMNLELLSPKGKSIADIEVYDVRDRLSKALVHLTPDNLRQYDGFVIRPR